MSVAAKLETKLHYLHQPRGITDLNVGEMGILDLGSQDKSLKSTYGVIKT